MGLAGPRKRLKISHDPNNTTWTRNDSSFGRRMLLSQGWTPGSYLGATDAPHSAHHTAANLSHVRVALREDNLGIGASRSGGAEGLQGTCTGLDVFQTVLGRLNGKSEAVVEREQHRREEARRGEYVERRWGGMGFVRGGWLVGDQMRVGGEVEVEDEGAESTEKMKQSKRRRFRLGKEDEAHGTPEQATVKSKRKETTSKADLSPSIPSVTALINQKQQDKQARRALRQARREAKASRKRGLEDAGSEAASPSTNSAADAVPGVVEPTTEGQLPRTQGEMDISARHEKKKMKRIKRGTKRTGNDKLANALSEPQLSPSCPSFPSPEAATVELATVPRTTTPTKTTAAFTMLSSTATTATTFTRGRNLVRQRYIRQKRMAIMDTRALDEILMVKTTAAAAVS